MTTPGPPDDEPTRPVWPPAEPASSPSPAPPSPNAPQQSPPPYGAAPPRPPSPPSYGTPPPPPPPYGPASPPQPPPPRPPGYDQPPPVYGAPAPGFGQPWQPAPPPGRGRNPWLLVGAAVLVVAAVIIAVVAATGGTSDDSGTAASRNSIGSSSGSSTGSSGGGGEAGSGAVAMTLPSGWVRVPLGADDFRSFLQRATKDNPQLGAALSQQIQSAAAQHIRYFAIRRGAAGTGFLTNVNVLTEPATSGFDPASEVGPVKLELSGIGAKHVEARPTRVGSHRAIEATYTLPLKTGSGTINVEGDQIYEQFPGGIAIITLSALHRSDFAGDFHKMASTVKVG